MKTRRIMMAVAMMLVCMSSIAQEQRVMAFQMVMAMHDTTYKNLIKDGKYKDAIAPLTTLINILDTTTICQDTELSPEMIKAAKADYLYDQACCFALTKQKKQALAVLAKQWIAAISATTTCLTTTISLRSVRTRNIRPCWPR